MIRIEDLILKNNNIRITNQVSYDKSIRHFFYTYQDCFSWGKEGKQKTKDFEEGLGELTSELKDLFKTYFLVDISRRHKGNWEEIILNRFL